MSRASARNPELFAPLIFFISSFLLKKKKRIIISCLQHCINFSCKPCESAVCLRISPSSGTFLPLPRLTPLGHHSAELRSLCYTAASLELAVLHRVVHICQCYCLSLSHPLLPCCVHKPSLHLCLSFLSPFFKVIIVCSLIYVIYSQLKAHGEFRTLKLGMSF